MFKTKKEKKAFQIGMIAKSRQYDKTKKNKKKVNSTYKKEKPVYLGPTYVNGKFYDTNFKEPVELTPKFVKELHEEYDFDGKSSDREVVNRYVSHMQYKYGSFDKNGKFLGVLGD